MINECTPRVAIITGITGQDGYYLATHLIEQGYQVIGTSRGQTCDKIPRLKDLIDRKLLFVETINLEDANAVGEIIDKHQPSMIFHLAGQSSVGISIQDPAGTFSSVVNTTYHLLEAIHQKSLASRIFVAGSSEIFGVNQELPVTCSTPTNPQNPYAMAKAVAFNLVRQFRRSHGVYACTGVLFSHESPLRSEHFVSQKIISGACAIAGGRQKKLHLGNLSLQRDWGWAPEYVEAMEKMLTRNEPSDFIIATGQMNQLEDFVAQAFAEVDLDWKKCVVIDKQFFRPNEGSHPSADMAHTTQHLGWTATTTMNGVVKKMVDAYQNHMSECE